MNNDDRILTLQEAAKYLRISPVSLWRLHSRDMLLDKPLRISKGRKGYRLSTLNAFLDQERASQ